MKPLLQDIKKREKGKKGGGGDSACNIHAFIPAEKGIMRRDQHDGPCMLIIWPRAVYEILRGSGKREKESEGDAALI